MCKSCRLEQVLRRNILHSEDKSTKCQNEYVCVEVLLNTVIAAPVFPGSLGPKGTYPGKVETRTRVHALR